MKGKRSIAVILIGFCLFLAAPRFGLVVNAEQHEMRCGLEFEGKDAYVDIGETDILDQKKAVTISHWVYFTSYKGRWFRTIASGGPNKAVSIHTKGQKFHFRVADGDGNWTDHAISEKRFPLNEWIHVTAVYDGSDSILYVNGEESGRQEIGSVTLPSGKTQMVLSAWLDDGTPNPKHGFSGLMSDVRIYDRALDAREVTRLYRGKHIKKRLVGWWPMNRCEGERVVDRSDNGNHGTITRAGRTKALIPTRLQNKSSDRVIASLVRMIKNHSNDVVRTQAANALARLDVSAETVRSLLQQAGKEAKNVKQVRPAVLLALAYYRKIAERPEAVEEIVPPLLDVLNNRNTSSERQQKTRKDLKQLEDQRVNTSMASELVSLLVDAKDRDAIRRALLDGSGALDSLSEPLDRGAEHPLPETPEQIAQYQSYVQDRFREEISRYPGTVRRISSLKQLWEYAGKSGVHVRMKPGIYEITPDNYKHFLGESHRAQSTLFLFSGSNSAYDLRGVEIKIDSSLPVSDVSVAGNRLIIQGLTVTNIGNEKAEGGGRTLGVKGGENLLQGLTVYARGNSYPYGYMNGRDAFNKLYRPGHISDIGKNVAVAGGGSSVVFDDVHIYQRGSGHALSWSGDVRSTFINCHIEGQVRMSDDILDGTKGGFFTDEGELAEGAMNEIKNILSPGEIVPLSEDAYRSYGRRGVTLKVLGGTVKNLRNAFKRGSYDTFFISNVRVSGINGPFAFTGGEEVSRIVNCELDLLNGIFMAIGSNEIDVTVVPPDPNTLSQYAMKKKIRAAYPDGNSGLVFGKDNTVYLRAGKNLPIDLVRKRPPLKVKGKGTTVRNETGLPIKLTKESKNCEIITNGEVTDNGEGNEVKHID